MRILGIDPGSNATGFGVVERVAGRVVHVAHGTLRAPRGASLATRLACIHAGLLEVMALHRPDAAAVERVFVAANPRTALVLGQARGVALAALGSMRIEVAELAAREVKKAVAGNGGASKQQMQTMVARLLALSAQPPTDAADALAVAICQAHAGRLVDLGVRTGARRSRRRRPPTSLARPLS